MSRKDDGYVSHPETPLISWLVQSASWLIPEALPLEGLLRRSSFGYQGCTSARCGISLRVLLYAK
jgi:uncharacterized membrane protein